MFRMVETCKTVPEDNFEFSQSRTTEDLQNITDYSSAIWRLPTPHKSEHHV
jgi:hypothetical protein